VNFLSDNVRGASPEILEAVARAARGSALPYGEDELTRAVERRVSDIFERDCAVFPVVTGSAANALALSVLAPPYGVVYCHEQAHIQTDECGGPEFYSGGAKLGLLPGAHGKIDRDRLRAALAGAGIGVVHFAQPAAVSLTQATEAGTVYAQDEVAGIAETAREFRLAVHMDGARFANAVADRGLTPAETTWKSGIDVLSFGGTKNGCLAAEAVVFFDPARAGDFAFRRKRAGHLLSKLRFVSAQLMAYLADDLWLKNARRANRMAARLAEGLDRTGAATFRHPVEANEIFVELPEPALAGLEAEGFQFHRWEPGQSTLIRLVTAFDTEEADVDRLIAAARRLAGTRDP
jgi:threonine aldolase